MPPPKKKRGVDAQVGGGGFVWLCLALILAVLWAPDPHGLHQPREGGEPNAERATVPSQQPTQ